MIDEDGKVKVWGLNNNGISGLGYSNIAISPMLINELENIKSISSGGFHNIALMNDGSVRTWGENWYGQLGVGSKINKDKPTKINNLTNVKQVSAGYYHSVALLEDGTVKGWGRNKYGQLGNGTTSLRTSPATMIQTEGIVELIAGGNHTFALMEDGSVKAWGYNNYGQLGIGNTTNQKSPVNIEGLSGVVKLVTGYDHTIVLMGDGTVKTWGNNGYGQLGNGTANISTPTTVPGVSEVVDIAAGYYHTMVLLNDGSVKSWGHNWNGQLGSGNTENQYSPITITELTNVEEIKASGFHSMAILEDGTIKTWGFNKYGQLGNGNTSNQLLPVTMNNTDNIQHIEMGSFHNTALMNDGTVTSWGWNLNGQLGFNKSYNTYPEEIELTKKVKKISNDYSHTLALMEDGTVTSWGSNSSGQLGIGNNIDQSLPLDINGLNEVIDIETGYNHSAAIMNDKTLKVWGQNDFGQLGIGNTTNQNTPTQLNSLSNVKQVQAGRNYTIVLMDDGSVKAFGQNDYGQLGIGSNENQNIPTDIPGLTGVEKVSSGAYHTIALMSDGSLKAWGYNVVGQLGIGNKTNKNIPVDVPNISNVKDIMAGIYHTIAILDDGSIKVWGYNSLGQLGIGNTTTKTSPVDLASITNAKKIVAGSSHTIALLDDNTIKAWGNNSYGQLGSANYTNIYNTTPKNISIDITDTEAPSSPQNIINTNKTDNSITIGWDTSSDNAGISSYEVYKDNEYVGKTTQTEQLITGLNDNTSYSFKVRAIDVNGNKSEFSDQISVTTEEQIILPAQPQNLTTQVIDINNIQVTWDSVDNADYYELEAADVVITTSAITYTHTDLEPYTTYTYKVRAANENGYGNWSDTINVKTLLAPPLNIHTMNKTNHSFTIVWDTDDNAESYEIELINVRNHTTTSSSISFDSLTFNTKYEYRIRTINNEETSVWSTPNEVYTLMNTPVVLQPTADITLLTLEWEAVAGAENYKLSFNGQIIETTQIQETIDNLTQGTGYTYSVQAINTHIISEWSTEKTAYTKLPCPASIESTSQPQSITIAWSEVENALWYMVELDGTPIQTFNNSITFNNLTQGQGYTIRILAVNHGSQSDWSNEFSVYTQLDTVTNIETAAIETAVSISWDELIGAENYDIEFDGQLIENVSNPYYALNLEAGTIHTYRIRGKNERVLGDWNGENTVWTLPSVPHNIILTPGSLSIDISWDDVTGAKSYEIELNEIPVEVPEAFYIDENLEPNTQYKYRVRAKNTSGVGNWSNFGAITTLPMTPDNIVIEPLNQNSIRLFWNRVSGATEYEIKINDDENTVTVTNNYYVHGSLSENETNSYRIRVVGRNGVSAWSSETTQKTLPQSPSNINTTSSEDAILISWDNVQNADAYDIEINGGTIINTTISSITINGLADNEQVSFRIRTVIDSVQSKWSEINTATTLPGTPTNIITSQDSTSIQIDWELVDGAVGYEIEADGNIVSTGLETQYMNTALESNTIHTYKIRVISPTGYSEWSEVITIKTKLSIAQNINTEPASDSITITWDTVENAEGYILKIDGVDVDIENVSEYIHEGLVQGTLHSYSLRAYTSENESDWSETVYASSLLSSPSNISYDIFGETVLIHWDESETAEKYIIEFNEVGLDAVIYETSETQYTITGLNPLTQYEFKLLSKYKESESSWSAIQGVTTNILKPQDITTELNENTITLSWGQVAEATAYDVMVNDEIIENIEDTSYQHEGLEENSIHKYRVRSKNAESVSQWSEEIVASTNSNIAIDIKKDNMFDFVILIPGIDNAQSSPDEVRTVKVVYNPLELELLDLCKATPELETSICTIAGMDIEVTKVEEGIIEFTVSNINTTKINIMRFLSKTGETSDVKYLIQ